VVLGHLPPPVDPSLRATLNITNPIHGKVLGLLELHSHKRHMEMQPLKHPVLSLDNLPMLGQHLRIISHQEPRRVVFPLLTHKVPHWRQIRDFPLLVKDRHHQALTFLDRSLILDTSRAQNATWLPPWDLLLMLEGICTKIHTNLPRLTIALHMQEQPQQFFHRLL